MSNIWENVEIVKLMRYFDIILYLEWLMMYDLEFIMLVMYYFEICTGEFHVTKLREYDINFQNSLEHLRRLVHTDKISF